MSSLVAAHMQLGTENMGTTLSRQENGLVTSNSSFIRHNEEIRLESKNKTTEGMIKLDHMFQCACLLKCICTDMHIFMCTCLLYLLYSLSRVQREREPCS